MSFIKKFFNSKSEEAEQETIAMEPAVISSAGEELEVTDRSVNHQEMHVVRELSGEEESLRKNQEQGVENTEEHPLVAMEPKVISSAGEEPEVSGRSVLHQEMHVVRELPGEEESLRNDQEQDAEKNTEEHPLVRSTHQAVALLRSQYGAGEIDFKKAIGKLASVYKINRWDYFTVSFSLCLLVLDVVSDISVGIRFLVEGEWVYGGVTLGVVLAASLIPQAINWESSLGQKHRGDRWFRLWIGPYMAFNMEPGYMYVRNLKRVRQFRTYKEQKNDVGIHKLLRCWNNFLYNYCEVAKKKQWEALLEAGPQMVLQLYILLKTSASLSLDFTTVLQLLALVTSLLGLTATSFTQYKAVCLENVQRIRSCPIVLLAIGVSFPIGCRAVSVAALLSVRPVWGGLSLLCHCFVVTGWVWYTYRQGVVVAAAGGLALILSTPGDTPKRALIFNVMWMIEDVAMLVLWWTVTDFPAALALLCVTLAVELVFRIVFCILRFNIVKLYEQIQF